MTSSIRRSEAIGLSVLVVGAGIGGLMTALECWRQGLNVRIIEKASEAMLTGDSFAIGDSALSSFKHWPEMKQRLETIAWECMFTIHNAKGEKLQGPVDMSSFITNELPKKERKFVYRYNRPEFHAMLEEQAAKVGINVEYGKGAAEYFEDLATGQAGVVLKDGSKMQADIVVAADGRRSRSWSLVEEHPAPARSSGHAIFRCSFPVEGLLADPELAKEFQLHPDGHATMKIFQGPNFDAAFARTETTMGFIVDHIDTGTADESWRNDVSIDEVLKLTKNLPDWPKILDRAFMLAPGGKVIDWKIMWRDSQEKWTSPGGRVIQLGDSAHAILPSSGNGATQALEDAISLAQCLAIAGKQNATEATKVHNLLRFERVSYLQAYGIANAWLRDQKKGKMMVTGFGKWLILHDPGQYAVDNYDKALSHIMHATPFENTNTPVGSVYKPWTSESLQAELEKGETTILNGDWS